MERNADTGLCHMMKSPPSTSRSLSQSGSGVVGVMTVVQGGRVHTTTLHSSGEKCWEEAARDHGPLLQDSPARYPPLTPLYIHVSVFVCVCVCERARVYDIYVYIGGGMQGTKKTTSRM